MSLYSSLTQVLAPFAAKINGLLTGWDGTKYKTPGEAVRRQITDLHVLIGDVPGEAIAGSAVSYDGTSSDLSATNLQAAVDETNEKFTSVNANMAALANRVSVVDGQLVIDGVSYDLGGVGIVSITKTGTSGLVDTYTILMTDGTSTTFTVTNGDSSDAKIQGFIEDWLDEHPEATTTIQDGSVTEEKLHPDLQEKMNSVHVDMGANSYKFTFVGQLYTPPSAYVAWGSGPKYDANLRKFVQFLYCAPQHMHSTATWQRVEIDPITLEANTPEHVAFYESDETTVIDFDNEAAGNSWRIMDDVPGHYQLLKSRKIGTANYTFKYNSYDYGKTWIQGTAISMPTSGLDSFDYKLSNGRLLTSYGGPILYSDDDGDTWTSVRPATAGGNYEAECAFVELDKKGTVMAIARYSKSGGMYYGDGRPDPAIISYSHDYGTTWTQWQASESIVDMNAIGCTALVHDGFVELFVSTRWYDGIDNYTNTGKRGCVRHYIATMENALDDAFTDCGIVHYAKGSSAQDLMSGELCLDGFGEGILCIPDSADGTADTCAKWYYKATKQTQYSMIDDTSLATYKTYSNKKMDALMRVMTQRIDELQLAVSQLSPDVDPPDVEPENILWTLTFDASGNKLITEEFDGYIGSSDTISTAKTTDTFGNYVNLVPAKTCFHIPVTKQNYAIEITQSMTARNDSFCDLGATFYINSELHALSLRNKDNKIKIINAAGDKELKTFADISYPCTITRRVIYRGELGTAEVMVAVNGTVLFESFDCTSFLSDTKLASEYKYYAQGSQVDVSDLCVFAAGAVSGFGTDVGVISVKFGEWGADIQQ
jgi:hypothetical protein